MSARQKILDFPPAFVAELDEAKARRFKARTMLIPSPIQVRDAIGRIPPGSAKSFQELKSELASLAGAETSCPFVTGICWKLVAEAAEEDLAEGITPVSPWWRITKDGKPNPKLPGGVERHRERLAAEGIYI